MDFYVEQHLFNSYGTTYNRKFGKKNNVLCTREMPEKHTGLDIAEKLQSIASEFDIIT